jgi:SAM-dependent methyltransferase
MLAFEASGAFPVFDKFLRRFYVNSSRVHLDRTMAKFAASVPANALVLDAASGSQPYRDYFKHAVYESADFEQVDKTYGTTTYVCDLTAIPVESDRFDVVVFNQGLEHMSEPVAVLTELHRVLKPGGVMICTAPLFYEEHEQPYDFFRYTQFAYRHVFSKIGFEITKIEWMEGYLGTVAYQLETASRYLPNRFSLYLPRVLFAVLAVLFSRMDAKERFTETGFPKNYVVYATKPALPG